MTGFSLIFFPSSSLSCGTRTVAAVVFMCSIFAISCIICGDNAARMGEAAPQIFHSSCFVVEFSRFPSPLFVCSPTIGDDARRLLSFGDVFFFCFIFIHRASCRTYLWCVSNLSRERSQKQHAENRMCVKRWGIAQATKSNHHRQHRRKNRAICRQCVTGTLSPRFICFCVTFFLRRYFVCCLWWNTIFARARIFASSSHFHSGEASVADLP